MEEYKLLLLGTGEAGKSTFVKQMKILHGIGFTEKEREAFKQDVLNNVVDGLQTLITGMETLPIQFQVSLNHAYKMLLISGHLLRMMQ